MSPSAVVTAERPISSITSLTLSPVDPCSFTVTVAVEKPVVGGEGGSSSGSNCVVIPYETLKAKDRDDIVAKLISVFQIVGGVDRIKTL